MEPSGFRDVLDTLEWFVLLSVHVQSMYFDARYGQRRDDETHGHGRVGFGHRRSALHVDIPANVGQLGRIDSADVPRQVFRRGIEGEFALIRHEGDVKNAFRHGNLQLHVFDGFAHGLLGPDGDVETTADAVAEGYLVLEINGDDDHVVGADVVRDEAEVAVRRNEGQDFLVFPPWRRQSDSS